MPTLKQTRLHRIWRAMRFRCYQRSHAAYPRYGGRGITVCDEWKDDYPVFAAWAQAHGYDDALSIDRIDNDRGYSPDNCRFVTRIQQARNQRNKVPITAFNETRLIVEWVADERCQVSFQRLARRIARGWDPEVAITTAEDGRAIHRVPRPEVSDETRAKQSAHAKLAYQRRARDAAGHFI